MADRAGQHLGSYRLVRLIGQGGFADVYLGEHNYLKTNVAIKILNTQLTAQDQVSFLNEAQTVAQLIHPNIVRVLDFGIDSHKNIPYMVMDYAPNGTLREKHPSQTRLNPATIVPYVQHLAEALQYIHDKNRIHLDVKPENTLIGNKGEILLNDFGTTITTQQSLQVVKGTVDYMAPEHIRSHPVAASDQYSLAIIVYEWLCGTYPFDGTAPRQIVAQHLTLQPLPLRQIDARISPAIEHVVLKALAKDALHRYATISAFASAFEQACKGLLTPPSPIQTTATPPNNRVNTAPIKPWPDPPGKQQAFSPNTRPLPVPPQPVPVGNIHANASLMIRKRAGETIYVKNDQTYYVQAVAWSPNALHIATGSADHEIRVRDASSGNSILTYKHHDNEVCSVSWSSDSSALASGSIDSLVHVWETATGKLKNTYSGLGNKMGWGQAMLVSWSPKSSHIAFASAADRFVQIWDVNSGTMSFTYLGHKDDVNALAWSVDGQWIASASDDKTVQIWHAAQGTLRCAYTKHHRNFNALAWAPDGRHIVSGGSDTNLHVWDAAQGDSAPIRIFTGHLKPIYTVAWSPDGRYIASGGGDETVRVWDIATGGTLLTYKGHTDRVNALAWSPNSRYIASVSDDCTLQVWQAQ